MKFQQCPCSGFHKGFIIFKITNIILFLQTTCHTKGTLLRKSLVREYLTFFLGDLTLFFNSSNCPKLDPWLPHTKLQIFQIRYLTNHRRANRSSLLFLSRSLSTESYNCAAGLKAGTSCLILLFWEYNTEWNRQRPCSSILHWWIWSAHT